MVIVHNLVAENTNRYNNINTANLRKKMEKLSSGYKINRAGDNAAGLAVSEKMRAQIAGITQAVLNAEDGISMVQTFEGALNETHKILNRIKTLAVQSSNGIYSDDVDRAAIELEYEQLLEELDDISHTDFNGVEVMAQYKEVAGAKIIGYQDDGVDAKDLVMSGTNLYVNSNDEHRFDKYHKAEISGGRVTTAGWTQIANTYNGTADSRNGDLAFKHSNGTIIWVDSATENGSSVEFIVPTLGTPIYDTQAEPEENPTNIKLQVGARTKDLKTYDFNYSGVWKEDGLKEKAIGDLITNLDMTAIGLGLKKEDVNLSTQDTANYAIDFVDFAINKTSMVRASFGSIQNRLDHKIDNLNVTSENLNAAESRIRDTNIAEEVMELSKEQILSQASQAMLAQANQLPQNVLGLLQ
jgi:flagellin